MTERYIFGAGIQGKAFFEVFSELDIQLTGFLDSFSDKETYNGLPVIRPSAITDKSSEIYISVGLISQKIKRELLDDGFENVFDYTESVLKHPDIIHVLKTYSLWYSSDTNEMANGPGINQFRSLLADKKSQNLLDQIVRFRTDFKADDYVIPDPQTQYFPEDVPVFSELDSVRFIDAGAYTGDTVKPLTDICAKRDLPVDWIACFEPDTKNLSALHNQISELKSGSTDIFVYPAGVWSQSDILTFSADKAASSTITQKQDVVDLSQSIFATSIDECLYSSKPNFIKMDVEGAEKQALKGARKTIEVYSPVLAICLYHQPSDLWEIPLMINDMKPEYDMYLRVYGDMLLETVLYCIPKGANS